MSQPTLTDALAAVLAAHPTVDTMGLHTIGWWCACGAKGELRSYVGMNDVQDVGVAVLAEARMHVAERLVVAVSEWSGGV